MTTYTVDARTVSTHFPGIGRYVSSLLQAMAPLLAAQEQIFYLCDAGQKARLGLSDSQKMRWQESTASPFGLRQQWAIPRLIRALGANVYHSPYYLMPYLLGVPTVLTVYDTIPLQFPHLVSARARLLFRWTTRLAMRQADQVIAISESTRDDFLTEFALNPQKIVTIPLAAADRFRPSASHIVETIRDKFRLGRPYVLYVGSNKAHKNLDRLICGWRIALGQLDEPHDLVLAGHWHMRDANVVQRLEDRGLRRRMRLLTHIDDADLVGLYSGAKLFIFPSLYEGFGLPVLEAMSCGCAVACSGRSSLPELVGQAGVLFDPEEPAAIADVIVRLLSDDAVRRTYERRALERAAAFSWEATAAATLDIYRQVSNIG